MSFQVKFGTSQSMDDLHTHVGNMNIQHSDGERGQGRRGGGDFGRGRNHGAGRGGDHNRGRGGDHNRGRGDDHGRGRGDDHGRGRGGDRGRGRGGQGGRGGYRKKKDRAGGSSQGARGNNHGKEEDDSGESDGGSSVSSEGQGRGQRPRGDRGRGDWQGQGYGGQGSSDQGRGGYSQPLERDGASAQQVQSKPGEVHIHYNITNYTPSGSAAAPFPNHTGYPGYPSGPEPVPSYSNYPPPPPSQMMGQGYQSQPRGPPPVAPIYGNPYQPPPLLQQQRPQPNMPLLPDPLRAPAPLFSKGPPPAGPLPLFQQPTPYGRESSGMSGPERSAGSEKGSRSSLNQLRGGTFMGGRSEGSERGSRPKLNQDRQGTQEDKVKDKAAGKRGPKGSSAQQGQSFAADAERDSMSRKSSSGSVGAKPDRDAQSTAPVRPIPEVSPDEWIKVFNFLLKEFNGRTKLGTLLSKRGDLLNGFSHDDAGNWLRHDNHFLTFEKAGQVKYVSITFKGARTCFKYRKPNSDKCENPKCPFFHICRDFIAGACPREICGFSHSFHSGSNAKVCSETGLQAFTESEICTIVRCSSLAVCIKFNQGSCNDECPDLHVCCKYVRNTHCDKDTCRLGHSISDTEHNKWVLNVYHMHKLPENTLTKMALAATPEGADADASADRAASGNEPPQTDATAAAAAKPSKPPKSKPANASKLGPDSVATDTGVSTGSVSSEFDNSSGKKKRERKKKVPQTGSDQASDGPAPQNLTSLHADLQDRGFLFPVPGEGKGEPSTSYGSSVDALLGSSERTGSPGPAQQAGRRSSLDGSGSIRYQPSSQDNGRSKAVEGSGEGGDGRKAFPASHYTHLCEQHTWNGTCARGYLCPRYHHRDRPFYIWQLSIKGGWREVDSNDSASMEQNYCSFKSQEVLKVAVDTIGKLKLSVDYNKLTATVMSTYDSDGVQDGQMLKVRRWGTQSYVEADPSTPVNFYTQWCWYCQDSSGSFRPFSPASLQYTLEGKYRSGQTKYYFEAGDNRFLILLQDLKLLDLQEGSSTTILRRPVPSAVWQQPASGESVSPPQMSSRLLSELPPRPSFSLPTNWCSLDAFQDFEMVELDLSGSEGLDVLRNFHNTLPREAERVLRVFRVQNPTLWDKYCCMKRSMTPRDRLGLEVDERQLFHGTPNLLAARGICANSMDFRRAGENVGAKYGRGTYFSAHALYSHHFTKGPDRYMFIAKVLVGQYTEGKAEYTKPPVREGLKLYDSCVDDMVSPSIFVIFDLSQSYPEYLIQYEDINEHEVNPAPVSPQRQNTRSSQNSSDAQERSSAEQAKVPPSPPPRPVPAPRSRGTVPSAEAESSKPASAPPRPSPGVPTQPEQERVVSGSHGQAAATAGTTAGGSPGLHYINPYQSVIIDGMSYPASLDGGRRAAAASGSAAYVPGSTAGLVNLSPSSSAPSPSAGYASYVSPAPYRSRQLDIGGTTRKGQETDKCIVC